MTGFAVFARKETQEILRTWRLWVFPGILAFFALTGPPLARYSPQILQAFAGDQLGGFTVPTPTYLDAYGQWASNVTQVAIFALVIIYGGIVSAEIKSGTAVLVLTKPVSRTAFVVVKAVVNAAFVALVLLVGTLATWGLTAVLFGTAPGSAPGRHVAVLAFGTPRSARKACSVVSCCACCWRGCARRCSAPRRCSG